MNYGGNVRARDTPRTALGRILLVALGNWGGAGNSGTPAAVFPYLV